MKHATIEKPADLATKTYGLKLRTGQLERLTARSYLTGVSVPEQIRRAIDAWLKEQGR